MPAYKDKERNTWYASFYYTDFQGERKKKTKRGFKRQKDALEFEREFLNSSKVDVNITFDTLVSLYLDDMSTRLKQSTMENKKYLIYNRIMPFFEKLNISDITPVHIRKWQNELLKSDYSQTYLKTINNQIVAIFNYAKKYYNLDSNPAHIAGTIGKKDADKMEFWTLEEFKTFIDYETKEEPKLAINILFWSGIRLGELLALTPNDIYDNIIDINKSYIRLNNEDIISEPKTQKSIRKVLIPTFLYNDIQKYIKKLFKIERNDRIFQFAKSYLGKEINRCCKLSGVKRIRVHDLRHSHASLLVNMDINILTISERLGHEKVDTTWNTYSHLYPNKQVEVAQKLDNLIL